MGHTLLTILTPSTIAAYTGAGYWGDETIYRLTARQVRTVPGAFAVRDRRRRLTYAALVEAADRLAAGLAGHGITAGPACRRVAAEPGGDCRRAARLLAQRLCLLSVTAPRPHGWRRRCPGRPHARRRA